MGKVVDVKFTSNVDATIEAKNEAIEAALEAIGNQCVSHAKQNITKGVPRNAESWYTPTGNLRNSISHLVDIAEECVYVGTNVSYAIYNEYGTGKYAESDNGAKGRQSPWAYKGSDGKVHWTNGIKPLHFLRNAVQDHTDEYQKIAEQYLKRG